MDKMQVFAHHTALHMLSTQLTVASLVTVLLIMVGAIAWEKKQ